MRRSLRGVSLIEVLTAIVVVSVAISLISVSWHLLSRVHRRADQNIQETRLVERLALRFRMDMRETVSARVADVAPARGWDLQCVDGRVIEYRHEPGGIARRVKRGDQIEHRDLYRLPNWADVRFTSAEDSSPKPCVVSFYRHPTEQAKLDATSPVENLSARQPWLIVTSPVTHESEVP